MLTCCASLAAAASASAATPTSVTTFPSTQQVQLGGTIQDTVSVCQDPPVNQQCGNPTGTVTFTVYGPGDTTCTGPALFTSTKAYPDPSMAFFPTSDPYTPPARGDYRWVASYSGDASFAASSGACTEPTEQFTVTAPKVALSPSSLAFSSQAVSTLSGSQRVTIENVGDAPLQFAGFTVSGPNPDDFFTTADSCALVRDKLSPAQSCSVDVRFAPQAIGARTAILSPVTDANVDPSGDTAVSLSGDGQASPQGTAGTPGAVGPAGAAGPTGAAGPIGLTGATGLAGPTGLTGLTGPAGAAGPGGAQGAAGTPGRTPPPAEKLVVCRQDPLRGPKALACGLGYNRRQTLVVASLKRNGHTYAFGRARPGEALRLKSTRRMTDGHYRLTRTYNGRPGRILRVLVLIG
ncbi:MAG TPA: choice-of-anchor D domain-containing protein [Solirubrobacteraceae bacterium]|nr:choice-of-anchor D domain-containing protein [Solirubrobacteraceae bacterium]